MHELIWQYIYYLVHAHLFWNQLEIKLQVVHHLVEFPINAIAHKVAVVLWNWMI